MDTKLAFTGINPFDDPIDRILAEMALSIQLPPSLHDKAKGRFDALRNFLLSTVSFQNQIEYLYPQGSMAIDATISNRGTDDEFDLDVVSQLGDNFRALSPLEILKALEKALADYPVQKIKRQTRCVTLYYADKMHLDVTPSLRSTGSPERESLISHAKGPISAADDRFVDMNAYGFAEWYRERTPLEPRMAKEFHRRWRKLETGLACADAEIDEVPDQTEFIVKNTATLALQLIKRYRNIVYAGTIERIVPSVLLSFYAARAAQPNMSLSMMVIRIAKWIIGDIENASLYGKKLHVANPVCGDDVFTDRWPESLGQQDEFARHLRHLVQGLEAMRTGTMPPDEIMDWLRDAFGDRVTTRVAENIAAEMGEAIQKSQQFYARRGELIIPNPAIITGVASTIIAPLTSPAVAAGKPHTFFGVKI